MTPSGNESYGLVYLTAEAELMAALIHPPRLPATVLLVVFRRNVISMLIEGDGAVVVAHIDFRLASGAATFQR